MGQSPCLDYAPVSVQVVKALEYELRELVAACLEAYQLPVGYSAKSREERTILDCAGGHRYRVSLGSLTHALREARQASAGPLRHLANRLLDLDLRDLMKPTITDLILKDVLPRFRNGGAHEHAVSHATCGDCIDVLVGSERQPGLILQVVRWRR